MANTESSRAKARSQSEPKQRPNGRTRQKSKQMELIDGMSAPVNYQFQHSSSHLKHDSHDGHDPWFIKLYQSMDHQTASSIQRAQQAVIPTTTDILMHMM